MSQSARDNRYDVLVDLARDVYLALSGQVKTRDLTDTETLILHKRSGVLAEFTETRGGEK